MEFFSPALTTSMDPKHSIIKVLYCISFSHQIIPVEDPVPCQVTPVIPKNMKSDLSPLTVRGRSRMKGNLQDFV